MGASDYQRLTSLPSCKRDAEAIDSLLDETREFEHRLCLSGDLAAHEAKQQIISFLDRVRDQSISQVLFYFSGHGTLQDGDLLYLLSDFDEARPRQTSLENKEVDNWLRDLNPGVTVKIMDCCHSGMSYVKDTASMERALAYSKGQFSACHFLAASQADEVAYAGDTYSQFTEHMLRGLLQMPSGTVRYKDLVDAVLDSYKDNSSQRPFIVQQGAMRDVFFEQTDRTIGLLKNLLTVREAEPSLEHSSFPGEPSKRSLAEILESNAKKLVTQEKAIACLESLRGSLQAFEIHRDFKELYNLQIRSQEAWEADIVKEEVIGRWIQRNGSGLFARHIEEDVKKRVPYNLLDPIEASLNPWGKVESKREVTGFVSTADLDGEFIKITFEPKYPDLKKYEVALLLLWSNRGAVLFWYTTPLLAINWKEYQVPETVKWRVERFPASGLDGINSFVAAILKDTENSAREEIRQRFPSESSD